MAAAMSRISPKYLLRGLKPIMILVAFTFVLNVFFSPGETVLWHWWVISLTLEGVVAAINLMLRLVFLVFGMSFLTLTTSPIALTDAIERLFAPLIKIRVPVHELAMMMTIALRFIPTLLDETDRIMKAQMARGADFESGNILRRAKAMIPLLVPLFISAIRRADDLALAMESRCYHGGEGRTRMKILHMTRLDVYALAVTTLLLILVAIPWLG